MVFKPLTGNFLKAMKSNQKELIKQLGELPADLKAWVSAQLLEVGEALNNLQSTFISEQNAYVITGTQATTGAQFDIDGLPWQPAHIEVVFVDAAGVLHKAKAKSVGMYCSTHSGAPPAVHDSIAWCDFQSNKVTVYASHAPAGGNMTYTVWGHKSNPV